MALYSSLVEELETVICLFDFHDIKESPRNIHNMLCKLHVSQHVAPLASKNASKFILEVQLKNYPFQDEDFYNEECDSMLEDMSHIAIHRLAKLVYCECNVPASQS